LNVEATVAPGFCRAPCLEGTRDVDHSADVSEEGGTMSNAPAPGPAGEARLDKMAHDVFSSEKREDIWAIAIALILLILCILFPRGMYQLFSTGLYLF